MKDEHNIEILKSTDSFKLPNNYFEEFQLDEQRVKPRLLANKYSWMSIAATIIILLSVYQFFISDKVTDYDNQIVETLSDDDINLETMTIDEYEKILTQINLELESEIEI